METKTTPTEKKAYHQPQLRDFGTVKQGTEASNVNIFTQDGATSFGDLMYSIP